MRREKTRTLNDLGLLFDESAAGIHISGESGSGKSNAIRLMMEALIRRGIGAMLIDPHGDLAAEMEALCASLPERHQRRVVVFHPANTDVVAALNPLAAVDASDDIILQRAKLSAKVSHVSRIFLHAWGERDFNGKPVMFKWTTRFLTTLASAGLTIPDVRHFFDVGSPVYHALTRAAPDMIARLEFSELAELRPRDREEFIASTKNRFLGYLENPLVELTLSSRNPFSMRQLVREGAIVIVNLERAGVLREEDVEIFANLWLAELLHAIYNTKESERVPYFCFVDELPVFEASAPLLMAALSQVRKFKLRLVCAHAGTQVFPEGTESRLLNLLAAQCGLRLYFRHVHPIDARYFGEIVRLPSLDPFRVKHVLTQPQQYQDGYDLVVLTDEGTNWGNTRTDGGSRSSARADSVTDTNGTSTERSSTETTSTMPGSVEQAIMRARGDSKTQSSSSARGSTSTETDASSWSTAENSGGSKTRRQTLVPRIRTREVITSVQFLSTDEQNTLGAAEQATLPTGTALMYLSGKGVCRVRLPLAKPVYRRTPVFGRKKLSELRSLVQRRPHYARRSDATSHRQAFLRDLISHLNAIASQARLLDGSAPGIVQREEEANPNLGI